MHLYKVLTQIWFYTEHKVDNRIKDDDAEVEIGVGVGVEHLDAVRTWHQWYAHTFL